MLLRIVPSKSIHVVVVGDILFFYTAEYYSIVCVYTYIPYLFIHFLKSKI